MTLMTYTWEDGICENAGLPMSLESVGLNSPGVKVLNFHPMNIFINGEDSKARLEFLSANRDLLHTPRDAAEPFRKQGLGARTVLQSLLEELDRRNVETLCLRELDRAFRAGRELYLRDRLRIPTSLRLEPDRLSEICGATSPKSLALLCEQQSRPECLTALMLVPVLLVVWADRKIMDWERGEVLDAAASHNILDSKRCSCNAWNSLDIIGTPTVHESSQGNFRFS